jgi:Leucine-rich repeat (LRR) protein
MSLIAALCIDVGTSIAKSILRIWFKDLDFGLDATDATITDILKEKTEDRVARHRAQRQFEAIGEKVGESLLPLFEAERSLNEEGRIAVALAAAETLNSITGKMVIQANQEPSWLARHLLQAHPAISYHFNGAETQLYQRTISEACEYIVDIAAQLPTFQRDALTEVLRREGQIFAIANEILQEVSRMRRVLDPQEKEAREAARFELEYRRAVVRHLDVLQLFGADVAVANRRHRLSVAYVMLSVEQKGWEALKPLPGPPHLADEAFKQPDVGFETLPTLQNPPRSGNSVIIQSAAKSALAVDEVLARSQYLLIRGLAGSGKTTLLQWIAVNAASQAFQGPLASWNDALPFYIRLRSCVQSGLPAPEDFPKSVASSIAHTMPARWVHAKLASGNAIVLVDGIDEIPTLLREEVRVWLQDLIETYPGARFFVTSRPHAIEEGLIDDTSFKNAELLPMELADIYTFIDHWHAAADEVLTDEYEKAELPLLAKALKEEIQRSRAKRNLATSPLLCAMLCSLNRERRRQLPSDRIELYEAFCQMLIERRDKERRVPLTDYPAATLTYRQKRMLLEDFAYWLLKNGWQEVELPRADERFARKLSGMYGVPPEISGIDARRLLQSVDVLSKHLSSLEGFQHLTNLKELQLSDCWQIEDLKPLANLTHLTRLSLAGCWKIRDLEPLANLTQLTFLDLTGCINIQDLSPLQHLTHLTDLNLTECVNVADITPLAHLTHLTHLDLMRCEQIQDLTSLKQLEQLASLNLSGCWQIENLAPIADLTQLTLLDLARSWHISDLRPLSNLRQLTLLNISFCERIKDLGPLEDLPNLKRLELYGISAWVFVSPSMQERIEIYR